MVSDFPLNPKGKGKGKAPLNTIEVIPSSDTTPTSSREETKGVKLLNVVNQAQKYNNYRINKETKIEQSSWNTWRARRKRWKVAQKLCAKKAKADKEVVKKAKQINIKKA